MYMLFATGLWRDKHVKPYTTDVSRTTITETAMYCTKISKQKQRLIVRIMTLFTPPPLLLTNRHDEYQNTLVLCYQREKLINNLFLGNLLGFLCEKKAYLLCFLSHFKSFRFLPYHWVEARASPCLRHTLTTETSPASLFRCLTARSSCLLEPVYENMFYDFTELWNSFFITGKIQTVKIQKLKAKRN